MGQSVGFIGTDAVWIPDCRNVVTHGGHPRRGGPGKKALVVCWYRR